jgi:hypothetical protein
MSGVFLLTANQKKKFEILTGCRSNWRSGLDGFDLLEGLGHDVAGLRW